MKLGGNRLGCALTTIGALLSLNLFFGCNSRPAPIAPQEDATSVAASVKSYDELLERHKIPRYSDFLKTVKPVRNYNDIGHTVLNKGLVKWDKTARAEYYRVWVKLVGVDQEEQPVGSPTDPDFVIENVAPNALYEVSLSAVNYGGESPRSAVVMLQTA